MRIRYSSNPTIRIIMIIIVLVELTATGRNAAVGRDLGHEYIQQAACQLYLNQQNNHPTKNDLFLDKMDYLE